MIKLSSTNGTFTVKLIKNGITREFTAKLNELTETLKRVKLLTKN